MSEKYNVMLNRIHFGDNLTVLKTLPSESIDLIYIDPPFNTGKKQEMKTIRTVRDENGDRKGFQGNSYKTIEIGTKSYQDTFDLEVPENNNNLHFSYQALAPHSSIYYLEEFLKPRLLEAYRILKPNGCMYFHIDYREVHYCKVLLDNIFGRESFINEIIWAYDFGGKAKSKWPAKHDNILFYAKNPRKYTFNVNDIDREEYMAPGLVGPEKALGKKLPTDTWFWKYVGKKGMRNSDTWWMTIVGTNSRERTGYPTQKPIGIINRIIKASSLPGDVVLDFFAGSGTIGESCLKSNRQFILIDNNFHSLEVMAERFAGIDSIEWINFDPKDNKNTDSKKVKLALDPESQIKSFDSEFKEIVVDATMLQNDFIDKNDFWKNSPLEWILHLPARSKSKLARELLQSRFSNNGFLVSKPPHSKESLVINGKEFSIKFSSIWETGHYAFQQIDGNGPEYILCFGLSPFDSHCWAIQTKVALEYANQQHKGSDFWISVNPNNPPDWIEGRGGSMFEVYEVVRSICST
jgi:site-specific DNA-methyltransferase (adenine-specific)